MSAANPPRNGPARTVTQPRLDSPEIQRPASILVSVATE